jgi:phosphoglucomutase
MHERAGTVALPEDLIDVDALVSAYYDLVPNADDPAQAVAFGTSGHRGSAFDTAFNELHILAITQAIVEYRTSKGIDGPLYMGRDTHALSYPAWKSAMEVLAAHGVKVLIDSEDSYTPTPAVSHAILLANGAKSPEGVRLTGAGLADGIVITPSHNPPRDGGFKYDPPTGGPADSDVTQWIADRANQIMREGIDSIKRVSLEEALAASTTGKYDFLVNYVDDLPNVIDVDAIRKAGVKIGADPLGGASVHYWQAIADRLGLDVTVLNPEVDPHWSFMTLDWDGKIRMDCSSPNVMASLVAKMQPSDGGKAPYDVAVGCDADADRHGIVTPDGGLMNPNHYLAACIEYLFAHRPGWPQSTAIGKTLVSSSLIDRVAAGLGRKLVEVPVGFKYFVPGLLDGSIGFGGEESAGGSFLRFNDRPWSTDKDGILMALLAAEIIAVTGKSPSQIHKELVEKYGSSTYARVDAAASREEKAKLAALSPEQVKSTELAGQPIEAKLTEAPGNGAKVGGLKVTTKDAWFAARPSGTENVYKIYAESFQGPEHLAQVQEEAKELVSQALAD